MYRIGIDTGGTFTDVSLIEENTGKSYITKVPSTPDNPSLAVLNGIKQITAEIGIENEEISFFIHGTTVATNAMLEQKGAKTALLTTKGFKDVLQIGRQTRPKLYDFQARNTKPLVDRNIRIELDERVDVMGNIIKDIDENEVKTIAKKIKAENIESLAICFINSYVNPDNEKKVKEILTEIIPEVSITLSYEVLPEFKEYERTSTTVANAYVLPKMKNYLAYLRKEISDMKINSDLYVMQSNGGVINADTAIDIPVRTMLSGPAGGVLSGAMVAKNTQHKNIITIDMGGTSLDTALIENEVPQFTTLSEIDGKPIKVPMIEMHTIGSGGGSIAWIDTGGALKVGPHSAGANPGPVCYGNGGQEPTVSDANAILGRLNPKEILGGRMKLDVESAREIMYKKIAEPLGVTVEEAAEGILKVINANMVRGIRVISVEKGHDPRDFSLMAFGGAGPLHAVDIAKDLNSKNVIIPPNPGIECAKGMLTADVRHDFVQTYTKRISITDIKEVNTILDDLVKEAKQELGKEGFTDKTIDLQAALDLRYMNQAYEIPVEIKEANLTSKDLQNAEKDFHKLHEKVYGFSRKDEELELINIRLIAKGLIKEIKTKRDDEQNNTSLTEIDNRKIYFDGSFYNTPIYSRESLQSESIVSGPAVIEQLDSTIIIHPGQSAEVDLMENLIINIGNED